MINCIFIGFFWLCTIAIAFLAGSICACAKDSDELYPKEDRTPVRADTKLRTDVRKRDTCKLYDEACDNWSCEICTWYEEG